MLLLSRHRSNSLGNMIMYMQFIAKFNESISVCQWELYVVVSPCHIYRLSYSLKCYSETACFRNRFGLYQIQEANESFLSKLRSDHGR